MISRFNGTGVLLLFLVLFLFIGSVSAHNELNTTKDCMGEVLSENVLEDKICFTSDNYLDFYESNLEDNIGVAEDSFF